VKKIIAIIVLLTVGMYAFGNEISSETKFDADAEVVTETLAASVSISAFTASAKIVLGGIGGADPITKTLTASLGWAVTPALSFAVSTKDAKIYEEPIVPLKFVATIKPFAGLTATGTYANANLAAEEIGFGSMTVKLAYSF
jgi:hypothetical protein